MEQGTTGNSNRNGPHPTLLVQVGQRFGRGVIIDADVRVPLKSNPQKTHRGAKLRCDCGNEYVCQTLDLHYGKIKSCGCLKAQGTRFVDRTGQRFGSLTVLGHAGAPDPDCPSRSALWRCRCDCGNETIANAGTLVSGTTASCGCARRKPRDAANPARAARNRVLNGYQGAARHRGLAWMLTDDDFDRLTSQDCHYCGAPPGTVRRAGLYDGGEFVHNGIDRVANDLGYILSNVVTCCKICNNAKKDMSVEDFMAWIARLTEYHWFHPELTPSHLLKRGALTRGGGCGVRIVFHSNAPWNCSGYGKETALFVPRIASLGHEIAISAPYSFGGNCLEWQGFTVFPCARDSAGNDTIVQNHEYFRADLTLTLADVFGLLKSAGALSQIPLAHWFPVDAEPLGEHDLTVLREGQGIPIAMSRFGERMLRNEGADPLFAPHGVDTQVYRPGDPEPFRSSIPEIGPDTFVIGACAMNRDVYRKGLCEQYQAFASFHRRHPDSRLAVHTAQFGTPGIGLTQLAHRLGISSAVSYPDHYMYDLGLISEEQMATWYNGLDVLSLCSFGEGFGLPLIEAQACGIPVITTDASAMNELCGAGWLVRGTGFWANGHSSWWKRPDVDDIDAAYEAAWEAKQDGKLPKDEARQFGELFDADTVLEVYWKPVLAELEKRIGYAGSDVSE